MRRMIKIKYILFIVIFGLLTGCINTTENVVPRRIDVNLNIENLGRSFMSQGDTIQIDEFKFIVGGFNVLAEDSVVVETGDELRSMVFAYNTTFLLDRLILSVPFGFTGINVFEGYHIFVRQARDQDLVLDGDFYDTPQNYSIIAKGIYNGNRFTLRLTNSFDKFFEFDDPVTLSDEKETLVIRMLLDVEQVFRGGADGEIINPTDTDNHNRIASLFRDNLHIKTFAARMIMM
jgi:hypothetical protein